MMKHKTGFNIITYSIIKYNMFSFEVSVESSMRIQPVAQVGTHDEEFGTVGLYQVLTLNGYECIRSYFFCRLFLTASRKAQREQGDGNACR